MRLARAFAAGRIINPRLARSQLYGDMIWGVSFGLHEPAIMVPRSARPMNANLAEYHLPVNADVPVLEAFTWSRKTIRTSMRSASRERPDRHHRHGEPGRERRRARHGQARAQIFDRAGSVDEVR